MGGKRNKNQSRPVGGGNVQVYKRSTPGQVGGGGGGSFGATDKVQWHQMVTDSGDGGSRSVRIKRRYRQRLKHIKQKRLEIRITRAAEPRSRGVPFQGWNITNS